MVSITLEFENASVLILFTTARSTFSAPKTVRTAQSGIKKVRVVADIKLKNWILR